MNMLRWPYPHLIAHRGGGRFAPENTAAALLAGSVFGYRMAEFDVKLSSDNIAFLLHDDTLDPRKLENQDRPAYAGGLSRRERTGARWSAARRP